MPPDHANDPDRGVPVPRQLPVASPSPAPWRRSRRRYSWPQRRPPRCQDESVNRPRRSFHYLREDRRPDVSPRLDALVQGWAQRSYLKTDGWWADLLLERFDFLRDFGFEVDRVNFRIQEHSLGFKSDRYAVDFLYSRDGLCTGLLIPAGSEASWIDDVLDRRLPGLPKPALEPFGRATVTARIDYWATGLRQLAPGLFGGQVTGTVDADG
jgi:hypothetical protein